MATGAVATKVFKNTLFNRGFQATPDYTAISQAGIGTGTTTPAEGDTALETPVTAWNSGADYKSYESGYPSFDEANKKVSVRMIVNANQANGNSLTEYADFNTDGTPRIGGHFVYTAVSKTSSIRIIYTATYRFT